MSIICLPFRSSIVLCKSKSRSWEDTAFDLSALSSTDKRVMEDLENKIKGVKVISKSIPFPNNIYQKHKKLGCYGQSLLRLPMLNHRNP